MSDYLLSIDQGTTSSRAILFSTSGALIHSAQQEFEQIFPDNGWVEHNPGDLWRTVLKTCQQVIAEADVRAEDIRSIGITNQRETTLLWDRHTGEPVYNAIVWQDRRTSDQCRKLLEAGWEQTIREKTGLLIDAYFSATKLQWLLNEVPGARLRAERGDLLFGTVDTFLLWHLTGGRAHLTDATNASRTLLFNIHEQQWDSDLLALFDIPISVLPEVMDSAADFGHTDPELFGCTIPIQGMAGDQQASLFGQACFHPGMVKSTYGTGCFLMANTGQQALLSENRLLTTVAYRLNGVTTYALEGSIFSAGATVQWLRDGLNMIRDAREAETMATRLTQPTSVYFVPAFTGLGAPHWDPLARAAILGMTRGTTADDIAAAALQSVAFQTRDLQLAMQSDGLAADNFRVDGGMATNNYVLQFLADILAVQVDRPVVTETTALGVAYLAGLQAGVFESLPAIEKSWQMHRRFVPQMSPQERLQCIDGWQDAVCRIKTSAVT